MTMNRPDHRMHHEWHVAINAHKPHTHFMYEAKTLADEVPRLALIFGRERRGELPKIHRRCSLSEPERIEDNHLTCCLGVTCRECPELRALDAAKLTPEQIDEAKAWTCAAHILMSGGDHAMEGHVLATGDRLYWDRVYESLAAPDDCEEGR